MSNKTPFDVFKDLTEKSSYSPSDFSSVGYIVNNLFSMDEKFIFLADEVNRMKNVPDEMKYDFYYHLVPKGKKYIKYIKKDKEEKDIKQDIETICSMFKVNEQKAKEYLDILNSKKSA